MVEAGYVALIKSDEPTLESPVPGGQYRVLHQSSGWRVSMIGLV